MTKKIRVRALEMGYYENVRRRPGAVFEIPETKTLKVPMMSTGKKFVTKVVEVKQFSPEWMEKVKKKVPLKDVHMPDGIGPGGVPLTKQIGMTDVDDFDKNQDDKSELVVDDDEDGVL